MKGYWGADDLTKEAIIDGWLITNDMAYIDDNGYVFLMGRADDIINIGGKKVSPFEIEDAVKKYNSVKECCCISVADPQGVLGSVPVVFITVYNKQAYSEELLYGTLKQNLEKYKIPYAVIVIDEMPKNTIGKFVRSKLADIWKNKEDSI